MSLPIGMEWEGLDRPEIIEGWLGILGCSDNGWDYLFGQDDHGTSWLFLETLSDGAALLDGTTMPDIINCSFRVNDQLHAERIICAIEGVEAKFVECKSGECSTCAAPVFHGPLDYHKEGE